MLCVELLDCTDDDPEVRTGFELVYFSKAHMVCRKTELTSLGV
jgi:hypothetical protein